MTHPHTTSEVVCVPVTQLQPDAAAEDGKQGSSKRVAFENFVGSGVGDGGAVAGAAVMSNGFEG